MDIGQAAVASKLVAGSDENGDFDMASGDGVVKNEARVGEEDALNTSQDKSYPLVASDDKTAIGHSDPADEKSLTMKIEPSGTNDAIEGKRNTEKGPWPQNRTDFPALSRQQRRSVQLLKMY